MSPAHSTDSDTDSGTASTIHLLHRRRGWLWTTVISVVAWVVTLGLLGSLAPNAKGPGETVAAIFVVLLTIVAVVALVATIADTVRLRRLHPHVRSHATRQTTHYPLRAHAYRYPPRHRLTWVFGWIGLVLVVGLGIATLPALVDGVAYVAGAEHSVTFVPTSYGQTCGRSGCRDITNGYLQVPGHDAVNWPGRVPLDVPFRVSQPLLDWGYGSELISGDGGAAADIVVGILFEAVTAFVIFAAVKLTRTWLRHRREDASMATEVPSRRSAGAPGV